MYEHLGLHEEKHFDMRLIWQGSPSRMQWQIALLGWAGACQIFGIGRIWSFFLSLFLLEGGIV